jgi:hypothetical protein
LAATELAASRDDGSSASRWTVRIFVLGAFALTVWLCGPRAAAVLAARFERTAQNSPSVVLDHVGFVSRPDWMDSPLLLAMSADLGPWLQDEVPILDEVASARLRDGLQSVPWVREATIERVFPDQFRLRLELRRPVLAVMAGDGSKLFLVDKDGTALPWVDTPLPTMSLYREGGASSLKFEPGRPVNESRVRAAAAIAVEWRDEFAPLVANCPELLEVDATNLGERWMRGRTYPEIRVKLRRDDGAGVIFAYDRPVDSVLPRIPVRTKATVLGKVLAKFPGLHGLVAGDLRLVNRWADYLQPRGQGVPDPDGPWTDIEPGNQPPRKR